MNQEQAYRFPAPVDVAQTRAGQPTPARRFATLAAANGHRMSAWYPYEGPPSGPLRPAAETSCTGCLAFLAATTDDGEVWEADPGLWASCPELEMLEQGQ